MGGDSITFPALIAGLEHHSFATLEPTQLLAAALKTTSQWVAAEARRVTEPSRWDPRPQEWKPKPSLLSVAQKLDTSPNEDFTMRRWDDCREDWKLARSSLGLVSVQLSPKSVQRELQLWRAMSEVDGYVCLDETRREPLRKLVAAVRAFASSESRSPHSAQYHVCALLTANPGAGKTFLVQQLAKIGDLDFVPFNVTQLSSRAGIVGWFDQLRAKQQKHPKKRLLVFVDEINAELDGGVYGRFLAPIDDGTYVREGEEFHLDPCVWIFAGTGIPSVKPGDESKKFADFLSRVRLHVDLNRDSKTETHRLETVYTGAAIIRAVFPDVRSASELVLKAFYHLPGDCSVREIKQFVRGFVDVSYGQVTSVNVPSQWPFVGDKGNAADLWGREVAETMKALVARNQVEKADIALVEHGRPAASPS